MPKHTETPPSPNEYHVCFCGIENGTKLPPNFYLFLCPLKKGTKLPPNFYRVCCPLSVVRTLFFWEFVLRRLYENLKTKSILYGIWKTVPGRKKKGEIKPVTKHPAIRRTTWRVITDQGGGSQPGGYPGGYPARLPRTPRSGFRYPGQEKYEKIIKIKKILKMENKKNIKKEKNEK